MSIDVKFSGFSFAAAEYLFALANNNNKAWFEANRARYETLLLQPFRTLVGDLAGTMLTIDDQIEVRPAIGKTLSRMHRDTRFSKSKEPYKTAMWLAFSRKDKNVKDLPGFFFEFTPLLYRFGIGCYMASKPTMDSYRKLLLQDEKAFLKIIRFLEKPQQPLQVCGEMYKRPLKNTGSAALQPWYQRKEIYLMCECPLDDLVFSSKLTGYLADSFSAAAPLYQLLLKAALETA
ncbi:MAG: DUF2461 domain-containing protein [Negativicutes bacterium]|jgi:uncharacterized protein (TIGR02453 family)